MITMVTPCTSLGGNRGQWRPFRLAFFLVSLLLASARAQYYLVVTQPSDTTQWANGSPFPFTWSSGLLDGLGTFDVELTRLNQDGLYLIAQNVPAGSQKLNIFLQDVPAGDDYFLVCLNSTHSVVYAVSERFTVTEESSGHPNPSPDASAPTVTVSGAANPLKQFAATLGPAENGALGLIFGDSPNTRILGFGGILVLCAALLGGAMTFW